MCKATLENIHEMAKQGAFKITLCHELFDGGNALTVRFLLAIKSMADESFRYKARYVIGGHFPSLIVDNNIIELYYDKLLDRTGENIIHKRHEKSWCICGSKGQNDELKGSIFSSEYFFSTDSSLVLSGGIPLVDRVWNNT